MVSVTNFVTCCCQPCTALDLLWPSPCCPPEGWGTPMCDLSSPTVGKETGWATVLVALLIPLGKYHHRAEPMFT